MNNFILLNTFEKKSLKEFIFKRELDYTDFERIITIYGIREPNTTIFTKDIAYTVSNNLINNFDYLIETINYSILTELFKWGNRPIRDFYGRVGNTTPTSITFTNQLILLSYFINYFGYIIIKYRKYISNRGYKNIYQIILFSKIRKYIDNFVYNNIGDQNNQKTIQIKKTKFNTSRNNKITIKFT